MFCPIKTTFILHIFFLSSQVTPNKYRKKKFFEKVFNIVECRDIGVSSYLFHKIKTEKTKKKCSNIQTQEGKWKLSE